jgi:hypothetical protein
MENNKLAGRFFSMKFMNSLVDDQANRQVSLFFAGDIIIQSLSFVNPFFCETTQKPNKLRFLD